MLGNIIKNSLLLRGKSILLKRYSPPQVACSIRNKFDTVSSKAQSTALETEDDDDQPIQYSTSKAAAMRIDEYRDPQGDIYPWYQGIVISISMAVFLIYFCIMREENDIDLILNTDLEVSLSKVQKEVTEKENVRLQSN